MKQINKRLTYANVMSSIAVFLVLGGATAFAASQLGKNSVGSKQLKNNAVTSAKIKNEAVTTAKIKNGAVSGAKINLGSLGTVPSATSATSATNATNAGNANTVGGNTVRAISFAVDPAVGATQILNLNGFTLTAACPSSGGLSVVANGPVGSRAHSVGLTTNEEKVVDAETDDALTPTTNLSLVSPDNDLVNGHTQLDLGTGGKSVSIVWDAESFPVAGGPDCSFIGYAIG